MAPGSAYRSGSMLALSHRGPHPTGTARHPPRRSCTTSTGSRHVTMFLGQVQSKRESWYDSSSGVTIVNIESHVTRQTLLPVITVGDRNIVQYRRSCTASTGSRHVTMFRGPVQSEGESWYDSSSGVIIVNLESRATKQTLLPVISVKDRNIVQYRHVHHGKHPNASSCVEPSRSSRL